MKSQNEWFDYNKFVNVDFSVERPMLIDDQGMFDQTILLLTISMILDNCLIIPRYW